MNPAPAETLLDEIADFLLSRPLPEDVIAFQPSDGLNIRLHDLLDRNKSGALSIEEREELDQFLQYDHLFTMLKAKARLKLIGKS